MKTITTYPKKAKRAKAYLIAGLILTQVSLMASESFIVNRDSESTGNSLSEYTETSVALNSENAYYYLNEIAPETEFEIEDWMSNIHNDYLNAQLNEEEMELEEWMYNTQHVFWKDLINVGEYELVVESWMINPNEWMQKSNCLSMYTK